MIRWRRIIGVCPALFCLLAPAANAATLGKAVLATCDPETGQATFQGRMVAFRQTRMQVKFTLQVGEGKTKWRKVEADRFDEWITIPSGFAKYTYEKTVEGLLKGSNYRAVVNFRWKNAKGGRVVRSERSTSPVCRLPDDRPDLVLRDVADDSAGYVAQVFNRGRTAAGPSTSRSSSAVSRWAPRGWWGSLPARRSTSSCPAPPARTGRPWKRSPIRARKWTRPTRRTTPSRPPADLERPPTLVRAMKTEIHPNTQRRTSAVLVERVCDPFHQGRHAR